MFGSGFEDLGPNLENRPEFGSVLIVLGKNSEDEGIPLTSARKAVVDGNPVHFIKILSKCYQKCENPVKMLSKPGSTGRAQRKQ